MQTDNSESSDETEISAVALRRKSEQGDAYALLTLQQMAREGDAEAQFELGFLYACSWEISPVSRDYHEAAKWWHMAAEEGHAASQYNLSVAYARGYGVDRNMTESVKWVRKAAENGDADAQWRLGYSYACGNDGLPKDLIEAGKWLQKAADQGEGNAINYLRNLKKQSNDPS